MIYAYTQAVSGQEQHHEQKELIRQYAESRHLHINGWRSFTGDSRKAAQHVEALILRMTSGDILIVSSAFRLSQTRGNLIDLFVLCIAQGVILHCIEEGYLFENNDEERTIAFIFSLLKDIEGKQISLLRQEGIKRRKRWEETKGKAFPKGISPQERLELREAVILEDLAAGRTTFEMLAKQYGVSLETVRKFLRKRRR